MTTVSSASCIISAWTDILYCLLGAQCLWIPPEIERALLPPVFKAFSDTHVVLDCTEIFCQTQSSILVLNEVTNITLLYISGHYWHGNPRCCYLYVWTVCRLSAWSRGLNAVWDIKATEARYGDHTAVCYCYVPEGSWITKCAPSVAPLDWGKEGSDDDYDCYSA